jgi:hypothetical protein
MVPASCTGGMSRIIAIKESALTSTASSRSRTEIDGSECDDIASPIKKQRQAEVTRAIRRWP